MNQAFLISVISRSISSIISTNRRREESDEIKVLRESKVKSVFFIIFLVL